MSKPETFVILIPGFPKDEADSTCLPFQQEFERNHGIKPGRVVLPGVEPQLFSETGAKRDIDILAVGSLLPLKQYDVFIRIVAEIKKSLPGIKAVLVGNGPEKGALEELV